jgi:hypothetical protein
MWNVWTTGVGKQEGEKARLGLIPVYPPSCDHGRHKSGVCKTKSAADGGSSGVPQESGGEYKEESVRELGWRVECNV